MSSIFKNSYIIGFFLIILAISISMLIYNYSYTSKDLSEIDLNKAKKLMIVAHPDDETLWGGAHLLEDDYLVVCITCGNNKSRVKEFKKTMGVTNDQYIMLGYPDKVFGIRSNWKQEETLIYNDLRKIIELKDWKLIVTHNKEGEYGHIHHIKSNKIVTNIYNDFNIKAPLYFFGKYYTKSEMNSLAVKPNKIDDTLCDIKVNKLIELYGTQSFIKEKFNQMFEYEDWIKYDNIIAKD